MPMIEELKALLPTTQTRLSASLTILLMPLVFQMPFFMKPAFWPDLSEKDVVLLQLLSAVLVLLVGSLITFLLVVRERQRRRKMKISLKGWKRFEP